MPFGIVKNGWTFPSYDVNIHDEDIAAIKLVQAKLHLSLSKSKFLETFIDLAIFSV